MSSYDRMYKRRDYTPLNKQTLKTATKSNIYDLYVFVEYTKSAIFLIDYLVIKSIYNHTDFLLFT